ncbi:MAG: FHA domain-containing protein [Planctomycetia bacterium]|nr:FHA domain-containing protein [Planctomycetia bacterium]
MYGVLVPVRGGDDIVLNKTEMVLGRHPSCDIVLKFPNISGKHCRLAILNGYWYLIDLKSSNGTKINGMRIMDHRADPGQKVSFASHEYFLKYDPVANGTDGFNPPEFFEADFFRRSLFENAGLDKPGASGRRSSTSAPKNINAKKSLDDGSFKEDYSGLTLDDLKFDQ